MTEVLPSEPWVRDAAHVTYLSPASPIDIIYNVDMREANGVTHFVMDAYTTLKLPDPGTDSGRVAAQLADQREAQVGVTKGYDLLKRDIEAAVKR